MTKRTDDIDWRIVYAPEAEMMDQYLVALLDTTFYCDLNPDQLRIQWYAD